MLVNRLASRTNRARRTLGIPADEAVVAACLADPLGVVGTADAGGIDGVTDSSRRCVPTADRSDGHGTAGQRTMERQTLERRRHASDQPIAAAWPMRRCVVALTDRAIHLVAPSAWFRTPNELVASFDAAEVAAIEIAPGSAAGRFTVSFVDGSAVIVEGVRSRDVDVVAAEAARRLTGRPIGVRD